MCEQCEREVTCKQLYEDDHIQGDDDKCRCGEKTTSEMYEEAIAKWGQ